MSNVLINSLQLNTGNIKSNIPQFSVKKAYNNFDESIYGQVGTFKFPTSGSIEEYQIEILLYGQETNYTELTNKEFRIYSELNKQVNQRIPILISTDDTRIYYIFKSVYILVNSFEIKHEGGEKHNALSIIISGIALGAPLAEGGTVNPNDPFGVGAQATLILNGITKYEVGFAQVGL